MRGVQLLKRLRAAAGCLLLLMQWCPPAAAGDVVDRIVAIVNDDIISLYELNQAFKPYRDKIRAMGYSLENERKMLFQVREELLNQLVSQKLTDQEIARLQITVDEAEVDAAIERFKQISYKTDETLRESLKLDGLTMEDYRREIKNQLLRNRLMTIEVKSRIVITQEEIRQYYEKHAEAFAGTRSYHLRNIIMRVPEGASEDEKAAVRRRMEAVLDKLMQGRPFDDLARVYSESSLAAEGGDLGFFRLDEIAPQLREALKDLKAGQHTGVIDTEQGYQVFWVEEIRHAAGKSLAEAAPEIEEKLYNEIVNDKFQAWLKKLREQSHIKIIQ